MDVEGRRVLLTGATGGLGDAIARDLASRGAHLVISGRRVDALEKLAADINAEVVVADLAVPSGLERVIGATQSADVLVANAGVGSDSDLMEMTDHAIEEAIAVNLRAPIATATAFARERLHQGMRGQIVFIGSLSGVIATPNTRLYNATKFGLRGFSLSLRSDLAQRDVGVSLVLPSFIREAGMLANSDRELPRGVRTKTPEDVARAVARAIKCDPPEIYVAPLELRLAALIGGTFPAIAQRAFGAPRAGVRRSRRAH